MSMLLFQRNKQIKELWDWFFLLLFFFFKLTPHCVSLQRSFYHSAWPSISSLTLLSAVRTPSPLPSVPALCSDTQLSLCFPYSAAALVLWPGPDALGNSQGPIQFWCKPSTHTILQVNSISIKRGKKCLRADHTT